jgi:hypothetical protein
MPKRLTARPITPNAAPSEVDAIIATIARTHLDLETLESRHSDSLDFKDQACWAIRDALRAAFEAGKQAARRRVGSAPLVPPTVIKGDIILTSAKPAIGSGDWVHGRIGAFRFAAKVYPEHALVPSYEIGRSRISKLELRRLDNSEMAYAWDRGLDVAATDAAAKTAVTRLAKHLANHCFGPAAE